MVSDCRVADTIGSGSPPLSAELRRRRNPMDISLVDKGEKTTRARRATDEAKG